MDRVAQQPPESPTHPARAEGDQHARLPLRDGSLYPPYFYQAAHRKGWGPMERPRVRGLFPAPCAPSPRLEPAPSGCCQPQWACCLFSDMAPRAHFRLCPALRGLGGSFPASRTMAILSGCMGTSEEVPGQGALRQPEEDGSSL